MKKLPFLLVLLSVFSFAQNQRFMYEYQFTIDSTKVDTLTTELMYLDVTDKGSKFYSRVKFVADSTMNKIFEKSLKSGNQNINLGNINLGKVRWEVEKTYPDYKITFLNKLGMDSYEVSDDRKFNWNILPEKEKIGKFETQKATLDFAGRNWTAWFAPEIPIQDGPYKFHGLPGLIVKMEDASKTHLFELKGVENLILDEESSTDQPKGFSFRQAISVNQKQYKKAFLAYRKDPNKSMRQMMGGRDVKFVMTSKDGKKMDMKEMMRNREKSQKEANKRNNNYVEKDILD